jgi:hypothetical protein
LVSQQILYKSAEVRKEIIRLFSSSTRRRVAITAFVGAGAESYLPKPKGIHLICWPKAGGTNPNVLRKLMKLGAKISFADSLHMKMYWAEGAGAIITSANLSTNALGVGNLKEIGIKLPSKAVDIDRIVSTLRSRPVSAAELRKLDRLHNLFVVKNRGSFPAAAKSQSFEEWYASLHRQEWKLGWWYAPTYRLSSNTKAILRETYEVREPHFWQTCTRREFTQGDWMLSFQSAEGGAKSVAWMFVDFVARLTRAEAKRSGYECETVQIWPSNRYPERPFLIDSKFRRAFSNAIKQYGVTKIEEAKSSRPSKQLLELIHNTLAER